MIKLKWKEKTSTRKLLLLKMTRLDLGKNRNQGDQRSTVNAGSILPLADGSAENSGEQDNKLARRSTVRKSFAETTTRRFKSSVNKWIQDSASYLVQGTSFRTTKAQVAGDKGWESEDAVAGGQIIGPHNLIAFNKIQLLEFR